MGAKSHRSTLTLFHQWPHHHASSGSSSSSPTSPTTPVSHAKQHHPQHPRLGTVVTPGTPDSPSQLDPFNNNSTHPSPLISLSSNPSRTSSHQSHRPASTSTSLSSRTGSKVSRPGSEIAPLPASQNSTAAATAPKIILASPSTSTIHYLFPSETRSNLSADRTTRAVESKVSRSGSVRRSQSAAGERDRRERQIQDDVGHSEHTRTPHHVPSRSRSEAKHADTVDPAHHPPSLRHAPPRSSDSVKHLSTGALGITLARPAKTPLGPAKRVVSGSGATASTTAPTKAPVRKSDISAPISVDPKSPAKSYGPMWTLRRQPSMADLGRGRARGLQVEVEEGDAGLAKSSSMGRVGGASMGRKGGLAPSESWGNKAYVGASRSMRGEAHTQDGIVSLDTPTAPTSQPKLASIHSPPTSRQLRRRSKSLNSPRLSPPPPSLSPVLPAPDFGNPLTLTLSDVIPSPSFSHLDYSTAGSSSTGPSRRTSTAVGLFTKHALAIFPSSVPMERGTTRRGLGSYDSGKVKAREDAENRLNGDGTITRRVSQLGRSVSLRRKDESAKARPRSQSLSNQSIRDRGISPPVPPRSPHRDSPRRPSDPARGIYLGDLSVDLGGRFHCDDRAAKTFYPNSPMSADTTVYPSTSPSSGFVSLPPIDQIDKELTELRVMGRPLHPAFADNASEISLLAPSTVGLGFSPIGTPVSLPSSLEAEAIDVTETTRRMSALSSPPSPSTSRETPASTEVVKAVLDIGTPTRAESSTTSRAALLSQNTYYIPPVHPRPTLRASKSSGPSTLRRALTFGNLAAKGESATKGDTVRGLAASPSIVPKRSKTDLRASAGTARSKRPNTAFSLCSPPGAIEPLPPVEHPSPAAHPTGMPGTEPTRLRSKPSSPFLSASASLRVVFGREGFVGRSLSSAFDRDPRAEVEESDLKSRISAPIAAGRDLTVSKKDKGGLRDAPGRLDEGYYRDQTWRRDVLAQAVSLSISSSLNQLSKGGDGNREGKIVGSSSKPRLGIPVELLEAGEQSVSSHQSRHGTREVGNPSREGADGSIDIPRVKVEGLSPGRTVAQVGRDESMASASVYSTHAPTARDSPRSRRTAPDLPSQRQQLTSRWSPSPVKKSKKGPDGPRLTISSPLPLFTPAHPSRLGLGALEPITSPPTPAPHPSPAPTVIEDDDPSGDRPAMRKSPMTKSKSKSRLMSIIRRHPDAPRHQASRGAHPTSPQPPSLTSPSSFSLTLLRSPKSVRSQGGKFDSARGISSEMVRDGEVEIGPCDDEGTERCQSPRARRSDVEEGGVRGVLDVLVAREEEGVDKERAKEEKMRKVLTWRREVGSGVVGC